MDQNYAAAEQKNADGLAQAIEAAIPDAKVSNMGWLVLVRLPGGGVFTLMPLSDSTCDLSGTDSQDQQHEHSKLTWNEALEILQNVETGVVQETSTGAVAGYSPANAFATPRQKSNRGTEQSEREGWTVAKPLNEIDRLRHALGEDPLGRLAMNGNSNEKKTSEGKKKSALTVNDEKDSPLKLESAIADNQTLTYLAEMLPCDSAEIEGDKLTVKIDAASIILTAQANGNFSVQSFVDGEPAQENQNIPASELIKWAFQICGMLQTKVAEREADRAEMEVEPSEAYEVLKELAREMGQSTDILRNPDLFSLRQGLCVARPPFERAKLNEIATSKTPAVQGSREHAGHPVSLNESRDASKPFADTLGGKVLRWVPGAGCILVDKKDLPPQKKLSWTPENGVILTEANQPTDHRGMWKFTGWKS